jgi:hypothetical protein
MKDLLEKYSYTQSFSLDETPEQAEVSQKLSTYYSLDTVLTKLGIAGTSLVSSCLKYGLLSHLTKDEDALYPVLKDIAELIIWFRVLRQRAPQSWKMTFAELLPKTYVLMDLSMKRSKLFSELTRMKSSDIRDIGAIENKQKALSTVNEQIDSLFLSGDDA